ncbi:MAG: 3'-5' exonuclease, partial [Eubacteriales bacterium]
KTLGMPYGYTIMDEEDAKAVLNDVLSQSGGRYGDHDLKSAMSALDEYRLAMVKYPGQLAALADHFSTRFSADIALVLAVYQQQLQNNHALDFLSLILIVHAFLQDETNLARWQNIYDFIQVDEMQDTGLIEYDIIAKLADQHKNLSLFGDTDQTIYEWRDSRPFEIIKHFRENFQPTEYILSHNFRSTKHITDCAEGFLATYFDQKSKSVEVMGEDGETVKLCFLNTVESEQHQIAQIIKKQTEKNVRYGQMALLVRTNNDARNYSQSLLSAGLPCYVIDEYNFFRREEIKDALAALKLALNPHDTESAKRLLLKYAKNIGAATLSEIHDSGLPVSLADFITQSHKNNPDFLSEIITPYMENKMVVFDVESTGLDTETDEIIEIAAVRFGQDGVMDEFHRYLKPTLPVGASQAVHGYTDAFLSEQGEDPNTVLSEFVTFCNGYILAGHNVTYDIAILKSQLRRLKLDYPAFSPYFDTLDAAKRLVDDVPNYKLSTLCAYFGFEEEPTHHAMDDVWATCELAQVCIEQLMETTEERVTFYERFCDRFRPFSAFLAKTTQDAQKLRPVALLENTLATLQMKQRFIKAPNKQENLDELARIFAQLDESNDTPAVSLRRILELTTLSGTLERQISGEDRVAVLTVHQAKGLQFDTVIIANAVEGAFPSSLNIRYNKLEEEARLFYVAMTRASHHLFITLSRINSRGEANQSSRFLRLLPKTCTEMFVQSDKGSS